MDSYLAENMTWPEMNLIEGLLIGKRPLMHILQVICHDRLLPFYVLMIKFYLVIPISLNASLLDIVHRPSFTQEAYIML